MKAESGDYRQIICKMKNLLLILLICLPHVCFGDTETSTKTVYVGETFTINPVSMSGLSSSKALSGAAEFSDASAFSVAKSYRSVTIAGTSSEGLKGGYNMYEVTALKAGTYTITGSATICTEYDWYLSGFNKYYNIKETKSNSFVCTVKVKPVPVVTQVVIPSAYTITIGATYTFSPQIIEAGATTTLTWYSSNSDVATIDASGNLKAVGVGTSTITCTAANGVSAHCVVTVNPILVSNVVLNVTKEELMKSETIQLSAIVSPENATNKSVKWSSSNVNVATVDNNGLVTAVSSGLCDITATAMDGSNVMVSCRINVLGDVLYIDDAVSVPSGTLVLPIQLQNMTDITGLQFELQIPEGVNVAENKNGEYLVSMSERANDHSVMCSKLSNGNYQFIVFSASSSMLSGGEGTVAYISLSIGESLHIGDYSICIKDVELTTANSVALHHKDMFANLTLTDVIPGDTNGDGKITVTDAVSVVNHILERTPSVFIIKAADMNGDSSLSITDAVSIINYILNK